MENAEQLGRGVLATSEIDHDVPVADPHGEVDAARDPGRCVIRTTVDDERIGPVCRERLENLNHLPPIPDAASDQTTRLVAQRRLASARSSSALVIFERPSMLRSLASS